MAKQLKAKKVAEWGNFTMDARALPNELTNKLDQVVECFDARFEHDQPWDREAVLEYLITKAWKEEGRDFENSD